MAMWVALIGAGVSAYTSYASSKNQADASTQAAGVQTASSDRAAALQYAAAQDALAFQKQQWSSAQQMAQPWVQAGQGAVTKLSGLMGIGGVSANGWSPQTPVASSGTAGIPLSSDPYPGYTPGSPQQVWDERQTARATSEKKTAPGPQVVTDPMPGLDKNTMDPIYPTGNEWNSSYLTPEERAANRDAKAKGTTTTASATGANVAMKMPDGLAVSVPKEYVEYYQQLGAKVVSNG
jgi:hypothetical protein